MGLDEPDLFFATLTSDGTERVEHQPAIPLRSWRITGREGSRRATVLNPSRWNTAAVPVNTLDVLPGFAASIGYASTAGTFARLAVFNTSRIRADITPFLR